MFNLRKASAVVLATATCAAITIPAPSALATTTRASDAGLYGASDPTYDGVFRQSLAILGLAAIRAPQTPAAVTWLLKQQCADGSFQAYRADLSKPCDPVDNQNGTGPDTNSTALAIDALAAVKTPAAVASAKRARTWLLRTQRPDGGFPYRVGAASDANSTGLSLTAVQAGPTVLPNVANSDQIQLRARRYLASVMQPCTAADGGALAYQAGNKPDASATSQGLIGISGTLPVAGPRPLQANPKCAGALAAKAGSNVARQITSDGSLTSSFSGSPDYTSTAFAVLGLVQGSVGKAAVTRGLATLRANANAYVNSSQGVSPGALGMLLMVSGATGSSATSFGDINLLSTLRSTITK